MSTIINAIALAVASLAAGSVGHHTVSAVFIVGGAILFAIHFAAERIVRSSPRL